MIKVELIDYMGTDDSVVNAARVSFDKLAENYSDDQNAKLIAYLAKHNHWSPFAHCFVSTRITAPIFVARQLQKHTVGLAWNEVSRRYVDSEPTFYVPETWRKRAENVKQGSSDGTLNLCDALHFGPDYIEYLNIARQLYNELLANDVAPEQARMVLPQSMMTEWIWSGSLYAFARVCKQRLDSHAQRETQIVAEQIAAHCKTLFPVSWAALVD